MQNFAQVLQMLPFTAVIAADIADLYYKIDLDTSKEGQDLADDSPRELHIPL